ncbi:MAG: hypothetical protein [Wigfec virus K19_143]|nr:MAG: hypothetical protein [Wigfec virus K19_143]
MPINIIPAGFAAASGGSGMLGKLIGPVSKLVGGFLGSKAADKNIKLQKQFAKNAIQWKVNDAKAAGIHPLYALGAQTTSFSPVSVGMDMPTALADMGQDVSRAVAAGSSNAERQLTALQLERGGLENELLRTQIMKLKSAQVGPALPGSGSSDTQKAVVLPDGTVLPANPGVTSAQGAEDRSGEAADFMYGAQAAYEWMKYNKDPQLRNTIRELETITRNVNKARRFFGFK